MPKDKPGEKKCLACGRISTTIHAHEVHRRRECQKVATVRFKDLDVTSVSRKKDGKFHCPRPRCPYGHVDATYITRHSTTCGQVKDLGPYPDVFPRDKDEQLPGHPEVPLNLTALQPSSKLYPDLITYEGHFMKQAYHLDASEMLFGEGETGDRDNSFVKIEYYKHVGYGPPPPDLEGNPGDLFIDMSTPDTPILYYFDDGWTSYNADKVVARDSKSWMDVLVHPTFQDMVLWANRDRGIYWVGLRQIIGDSLSRSKQRPSGKKDDKSVVTYIADISQMFLIGSFGEWRKLEKSPPSDERKKLEMSRRNRLRGDDSNGEDNKVASTSSLALPSPLPFQAPTTHSLPSFREDSPSFAPHNQIDEDGYSPSEYNASMKRFDANAKKMSYTRPVTVSYPDVKELRRGEDGMIHCIYCDYAAKWSSSIRYHSKHCRPVDQTTMGSKPTGSKGKAKAQATFVRPASYPELISIREEFKTRPNDKNTPLRRFEYRKHIGYGSPPEDLTGEAGDLYIDVCDTLPLIYYYSWGWVAFQEGAVIAGDGLSKFHPLCHPTFEERHLQVSSERGLVWRKRSRADCSLDELAKGLGPDMERVKLHPQPTERSDAELSRREGMRTKMTGSSRSQKYPMPSPPKEPILVFRPKF